MCTGPWRARGRVSKRSLLPDNLFPRWGRQETAMQTTGQPYSVTVLAIGPPGTVVVTATQTSTTATTTTMTTTSSTTKTTTTRTSTTTTSSTISTTTTTGTTTTSTTSTSTATTSTTTLTTTIQIITTLDGSMTLLTEDAVKLVSSSAVLNTLPAVLGAALGVPASFVSAAPSAEEDGTSVVVAYTVTLPSDPREVPASLLPADLDQPTARVLAHVARTLSASASAALYIYIYMHIYI